MAVALFLLTSNGLPDLGEDVEFVPIASDRAARSSERGIRAVGQHGCMTTLVADYGDLDALRHDVSRWWLDIANARPSLELLATEPAHMSAEQRKLIARLEPQSWSIRTPLVVYRTNQPEAALEARRFVTETALRGN